MFSHDLNFSPKIFNNSWEKSEDWEKLQSRMNVASQYLSGIKTGCADAEEETCVSPESITEEVVINTLRSSESPETIYWMLRYFAEANFQKPVIDTDRGKTIYIELDRMEESVSVYVGSTCEVLCFGEEGGSKIYAMDVQERYDFVWYAFLGVALKRRISAEAIQEHANLEQGTDQASMPTLFYTTGQQSVCTMRTDWWYQRKRHFAWPEYVSETQLTSCDDFAESPAASLNDGENVVPVFPQKQAKDRQAV